MTPLPYREDGAALAAHFADLPGMVFLDSRRRPGERSGWDVIAALPEHLLCVEDYDHNARDWMASIERLMAEGAYPAPPEGWPFATGALGYLDYDTATQLYGVRRWATAPARAGLYRASVVQCHDTREAWLVADPQCPVAIRETLLARCIAAQYDQCGEPTTARLVEPFTADTAVADYLAAIERIQTYLRAGDCYQVNFAHRFSAVLAGDPWAAYRQYRNAVQGAFSAYLSLTDGHAVLSLSPERFLSVDGIRVITQPIKGTAPRHEDPEADTRAAELLLSSAKDRAENVMITDLLRNDLGHWCRPGSVRTTELCALHSYSNVHHLVSTVTGDLRPEVSAGQLLVASSPGGSITGAPKKRAIEVIAELEPSPRGAYCGSVFSLAAGNRLRSSIAIRTLELNGDQLVCWGGGGITVDSVAEAEYRETLDKVGALLSALNP